MRIISGKLKGKKLNIPKNIKVRPTTDQSKEALFNILVNRFNFKEIKVLDLFSGTGSISFEFSSRGVKTIYSIDKNYNSVNFIKNFSVENDLNIKVLKKDIFKSNLKTDVKFDLIFADPPYSNKKNYYTNLLLIIRKKIYYTKDTLLILEHPENIDLKKDENIIEERKYGGCVFSFIIL
tara:strand:+ start:16800 stop:17336 length:537 start_codon:yes stop_codon:yes gene_type:complete